MKFMSKIKEYYISLQEQMSEEHEKYIKELELAEQQYLCDNS